MEYRPTSRPKLCEFTQLRLDTLWQPQPAHHPGPAIMPGRRARDYCGSRSGVRSIPITRFQRTGIAQACAAGATGV